MFQPVSNQGFLEVLDLTPLDLSNTHDRTWAMEKIQKEEPRLIIGTTNTDFYQNMSSFDRALHRNFLWKIARNQAAGGRTFIISHENNLDDGLSKGLQELYSMEDVEFLPVSPCERGMMETFRTTTCPQCSTCSYDILEDHRRRQCPTCEQWVCLLYTSPSPRD